MARLLAHENFPLPISERLRELGHDVTTLAQFGKANLSVSDEEVLALATAEGRVLLSHNRKHFIQLHLADRSHAGIVACTFDPNFGGQASRIDEALGNATEFAGELVRVYRPDR